MAPTTAVTGKVVNYSEPKWQPLLDFARECIDDFMWMHEVELEDGTHLQAYKHIWTRRYIHLTGDGRAFVYVDRDRYEHEPDARLWLQLVVRPRPGCEPEWHVPPYP
jgi:hypothetical protein